MISSSTDNRADVSLRPYRSRSPVDFGLRFSTDAIRPRTPTIRPSAIPSSGMISLGTEFTNEEALAPPSVAQARTTSNPELNRFLRSNKAVVARRANVAIHPCVPGMLRSRPIQVPRHHEMLIAGSRPRVKPDLLLCSSIDRCFCNRSSFVLSRVSSDVKIEITPGAKLLLGVVESCSQCTSSVVFPK